MAIIYKATNKVNNKIYVGFTTKSLDRRKWEHNNDATRMDRISNTKFYRAIRKYGIGSFVFEVLLENSDSEFLLKHEESRLIRELNAISEGYNICAGGKGQTGTIPWNKGISHSAETVEKIREKAIGRKQSQETVERRVAKTKGLKRSADTKTKMAGEWGIKFPDGHEEVISNLSDFCKMHSLTLSNMVNVANGYRRQHKNYICWRVKISPQSRM